MPLPARRSSDRLRFGDERSIRRPEAGQRVRFVPGDLVDARGQRALRARRCRRRHVCQRLLVQRQCLERLARVAIPQHLAGGLPVRRLGDVGVDGDRSGVIGVVERTRQLNRRVHRFGAAGEPLDAPREDRVLTIEGNDAAREDAPRRGGLRIDQLIGEGAEVAVAFGGAGHVRIGVDTRRELHALAELLVLALAGGICLTPAAVLDGADPRRHRSRSRR